MLKIPAEAKKSRTLIINKENAERMRRLQDGDTMNERIGKEIEKQVEKPYVC
jgi:hypothetical protein